MEAESVGAGAAMGMDWAAVSDAVAQEMATWQAAHPRATLAEMEQGVEAVTQGVRRFWLEELTGAAADAVEERPTCPQCQTPMERRGRKEREVLVARQREAVRLVRAYFSCPACGAGLFPPG